VNHPSHYNILEKKPRMRQKKPKILERKKDPVKVVIPF